MVVANMGFWEEVVDSIFFKKLCCFAPQLVESSRWDEIAAFSEIGYLVGRERCIAQFGELFDDVVRILDRIVGFNLLCFHVLYG